MMVSLPYLVHLVCHESLSEEHDPGHVYVWRGDVVSTTPAARFWDVRVYDPDTEEQFDREPGWFTRTDPLPTDGGDRRNWFGRYLGEIAEQAGVTPIHIPEDDWDNTPPF